MSMFLTAGSRGQAALPGAQVAVTAAVGALLLWFVLPAFTATYNEGFQAVVVMNAHAILDGGLGGIDPLHGLDNDFMLFSRLGVSAVLAGLIKLGIPAIPAFRGVMILSLALLVVVNAALLSWRCLVHPVLACIPALLFPGMFESAWFFNDNVLSAALSSTALLLFWRGRSLGATAGAGLLLGAALACRTDAVLLAPAFVLIGWSRFPCWSDRIGHGLLGAAAGVVVPVALYAGLGLNILEIPGLTRRATEMWARTDPWINVVLPALKGFALPGLLLVGAGAVALLVRRRWFDALLCLGAPLLYGAAYGRMMSEVRYLLPLTPFFGILTIEGWRAILAWRGHVARKVAFGALAACILACLLPPAVPHWRAVRFMAADHDMPRPLLGRFWSPLFGMWWNRTLAAGTDAIGEALRARAAGVDEPGIAGEGRTVLVASTWWTPDRLVALTLREQGLRPAQDSLPPSCRKIAELYAGPGLRVVHLRPHIPMVPDERTALTWDVLALPCLKAMGATGDTAVLVAGWMELTSPPAALGTPGMTDLFVPAASTGPFELHGTAASIAARRFGTYVAAATVAKVPAVLNAPANSHEAVLARATLDRPDVWADTLLLNLR